MFRCAATKNKSERPLSAAVYHAEPCPIASVIPVRQTVTKPTFSRVCKNRRSQSPILPSKHILFSKPSPRPCNGSVVFRARATRVEPNVALGRAKRNGFCLKYHYLFSCSRYFRALTIVSYRFTPGGNRVVSYDVWPRTKRNIIIINRYRTCCECVCVYYSRAVGRSVRAPTRRRDSATPR